MDPERVVNLWMGFEEVLVEMDESHLIVEVDFSKIGEAMARTMNNYCLKHDWDSSFGTPCHPCEREARDAEVAKHTPKQKHVTCQHCGYRSFTFWGEKPYTCGNCIPTQQHQDNLAEFMRELDSP